MPELVKIPLGGVGKFGKPRYRRAVVCVYSHCRKEGTVEEVRACEKIHREELAKQKEEAT